MKNDGVFVLVGVSTRALAESAVKSGFNVVAFDFFADLDQQALCKVTTPAQGGRRSMVTNLLELAREEILSGSPEAGGVRGVICASGPENHPEALRWFWERGLLVGNSPDTLERVRNPFLLEEALRGTDVCFPETHHWERSIGLLGRGKRWLIKPLRGGGGRGIRVLESGGEGLLGKKVVGEGKYVIQEFVPGLPCSATFAADGRRAQMIGASLQLIAGCPGKPFRYGGNIAPLSPPRGLTPPFWKEKLAEAAHALVSRFALKGLNTVDFILNGEGIWILEVNPRWSGSVELFEYLRGRPLFSEHLSACALGDSEGRGEQGGAPWSPCRPTSARNPRQAYWGKAILYAPHDFRVAREWRWEQVYLLGMRDIPRPGTLIKAGHPVCTVLAAGSSPANCWRRLSEKLKWALWTLEGKRVQAVR